MVVLAACVIVLLKGLWVLRMYRLFRGAKVVITTIVFGMLIVVLVRWARGPSPVFGAGRPSAFVPMARRYLSLRDLTMFIMSFYFLIWGTLQCLVSLGVKGNAVMAAAQAYESGSHACADFRPPLRPARALSTFADR